MAGGLSLERHPHAAVGGQNRDIEVQDRVFDASPRPPALYFSLRQNGSIVHQRLGKLAGPNFTFDEETPQLNRIAIVSLAVLLIDIYNVSRSGTDSCLAKDQ